MLFFREYLRSFFCVLQSGFFPRRQEEHTSFLTLLQQLLRRKTVLIHIIVLFVKLKIPYNFCLGHTFDVCFAKFSLSDLGNETLVIFVSTDRGIF